jgi:DNA-binding transcriptional regulator YhcF (GntR family)
MIDNPPDMHRSTYVFERGNWLVKGKQVQADIPHALNPFPKNAPRNRMGLAMWLTDKRNPLTARTMVNRIWEQLFGAGIVETLEDMGTQGAEPTHKELLDFLAWQFMNKDGWSIKKLLKKIVLSATYRQTSKASKELLEKDPYNKLYARGARLRLSAEQVRDQALAASGLLSKKMYGPGVMPWQPEGIWMSPWNGDYWKKSEGEDQYRRAVYTFWKRTAPYPSMISFDGVGREVCTSRRIRTNTPLQALVTLNDSVYIEASRHFAFWIKERAESDNIRQQIGKAYETLLFKPIAEAKLNALEALYKTALQGFKMDADKTCEMIGVNDEHNNAETAALVVVMSALLNLDEVVTKS